MTAKQYVKAQYPKAVVHSFNSFPIKLYNVYSQKENGINLGYTGSTAAKAWENAMICSLSNRINVVINRELPELTFSEASKLTHLITDIIITE